MRLRITRMIHDFLCKVLFCPADESFGKVGRYTAIAVRKTWVLHKLIKNRPTLAYKNIVRKCYEDMFFITNMQFNNPTSMPQT